MKKLLLVLGLSLFMFSLQASAASTDLGMIDDNGSFCENRVVSAFSKEFTFKVPSMATTSISITNSFVGEIGKILGFAATLDNTALELTAGITAQRLEGMFENLAANTVHTLVVSGSGVSAGSSSSFASSIQVAIGQAPIPAAIWLFGSALLGLTGIKRRQALRG